MRVLWLLVRRSFGFIVDRFIVIAIADAMLWIITLIGIEQRNILHIRLFQLKGIPIIIQLALTFLLGFPFLDRLILISVYSILTIAVWKKTPGMFFSDINLRALDSKDLRFSQVVSRHIASYVSGMAFGLGYIWAVVDRRGRTWHDILSKTIVESSEENER